MYVVWRGTIYSKNKYQSLEISKGQFGTTNVLVENENSEFMFTYFINKKKDWGGDVFASLIGGFGITETC